MFVLFRRNTYLPALTLLGMTPLAAHRRMRSLRLWTITTQPLERQEAPVVRMVRVRIRTRGS